MNKIITLVVGFIVIILIFVWVSGRIRTQRNAENTLPAPTLVATTSPTPQPSSAPWYSGILNFNRRSSTPTPAQKNSSNTSQESKSSSNSSSISVVQISPTKSSEKSNQTYIDTQKPTEIPQTGSPTILLPLTLLALGAGFYLKRS